MTKPWRMLRSLRATVGERLEHRTRALPPMRRARFNLVRGLVEELAEGRPLEVLDAGAAEALFAERLARGHPDWRVVAAELDDTLLERARRRLEDTELPNLELVKADLTKPLPMGPVDVVLAIECLVEIADDQAALRNLAAVLRPGGTLIAHVPRAGWSPVLRSSAHHWRLEARHGYREAELVRLADHAGLAVTGLRPSVRSMLFLGQEVADRIKDLPVRVRAACLPITEGTVALERSGITWGPTRALLLIARRR
jgi:SAM-dependent methyltransferase